MKQAACVFGVVALLGAGCTGTMTKVGVGIGVGVAAVGCVPLLVQGDGSMGPPVVAATGGVVGGAIVVGSLIGYAIGAAMSSENRSAERASSQIGAATRCEQARRRREQLVIEIETAKEIRWKGMTPHAGLMWLDRHGEETPKSEEVF